jgi:hypothetical protein
VDDLTPGEKKARAMLARDHTAMAARHDAELERSRSETIEIALVGRREGERCAVTRTFDGEHCLLTVLHRAGRIEAAATDFFEAMCAVRRELEREGLLVRCYGGSLNVHPSGMGRDMGQGLLAYRTTFGKHAARSDLVDIFASGPDVVPATVHAQAQHHLAWLSSLKSEPTAFRP